MLEFDAVAHAYTWSGRPVPGVTRVLQLVQDFSMVPAELLARKQQIGTALHAAIELGDDLDPDSLDPLVEPYYDAWSRFMVDTGFQPVHNEIRIFSARHTYAGTLDTIGVLKRRECLIDYKSSWELHPAVGPQTAAYLNGAYEMKVCPPDLPRYALQLRRDRSYRLEPLTEASDFAVFLSLLNIHNWRKRHGIQQ